MLCTLAKLFMPDPLVMEVRTALVALIAFLPTKPNGAMGSVDDSKERRQALAIKSRAMPPKFGNADRQKLIAEIHECMLKKAPALPELHAGMDNSPSPEQPASAEGDGQANAVTTRTDNLDVLEQSSTVEGDDQANAVAVRTAEQPEVVEPQTVENLQEVHVNANAGPLSVSISLGLRLPTRALNADTQTVERDQEVRNNSTTLRQHKVSDDRQLTLLAVGLSVAIIALLVKKFLKSHWWIGA